jgi:hypothetical protein
MVFFAIGVILMSNPLAIAGFGALGPVAGKSMVSILYGITNWNYFSGSLAAAWQSTMGGTVAAGSVFAVLQSWGMIYSVVIPAAGAIIAGGSIVARVARDQIVSLLRIPRLLQMLVGRRLRGGA